MFSGEKLTWMGVLSAGALADVETGRRVLVAGMVTHRQRPATASGIIFINLEDESGMINVVCSTGFWSKYRKVARESPSLLIRGMLERQGAAFSVLAERIAPLNLIAATPSRALR